MNYTVCIGNTEVKWISPICIDWQTPYLNLFFDKVKAKEKGFADNGKHWQYTDTDFSFKTVNMNVYLDDCDHISSIDFYKYQATSFNHGKNTSKELSVTAADRKVYLAVLQEVILDPSEDELISLISVLEQSDFGKERQLQVRKNDLSLLDQNGIRQTIKRKTILRAIQISHEYLEIIHNDKVFLENPKEFPPEICPILHEILAFVDIEKYYRIDELRYDMSMRAVIADAEEKYPLLRQAAIDGNVNKVRELAPYAKLVPGDKSQGSPLYHAVKGNHTEIVKILLENGAYTLEMDRDGTFYPLETAYLNGNREIIRLLISYHGATSKTYGVFKHNTDNLLKLCAANKDYEVLELIAPEAYTYDTRTWLTPEMFPDMADETILALSRCKGIRMAWSLDLIRPIYEKKDLNLCRNMLLQGSTQEVIDFFIAQNDYEMFEASVQCHASVYVSNESYAFVFERGGKWIDTLAKHVVNLDQKENKFFENLLNSGNIERYLAIVNSRGCPFMGLGGYMVWPEKVKDPEKYIVFLRLIMSKNEPCRFRRLFLEDIVRLFGDEQLAKDYFGMFPISPDIEWRSFLDNSLMRNYIWRANNVYAGAELVRSFFKQDVDDKIKKAFDLVIDLILESASRSPVEMTDDESTLSKQERCCLYMLEALLSCVDIREIDALFAQTYERQGIHSAYEFCVNNGRSIKSKRFVDLLKAGK